MSDTRHLSMIPLPQRLGVAVASIALVFAAAACTKEELPATHPVVLEAASSSGESPWTAPVTSPEAPTDLASEFAPLSLDTAVNTDGPIELAGDTPMLYGGSGGLSVCDAGELVSFLEENPAKAAAFGDVVGASDVRSFVDSLAPVLLTHDTVVTNHGFEDGKPTPFQSVLQAGTAVMADRSGTPQVRCQCGNPLRPPEPMSADEVEFSGTPWTNFASDRVTEIAPSPQPLQRLTTVEVKTLSSDTPPTPVAVPFEGEGVGQPEPPSTLTEEETPGTETVTEDTVVPDLGEQDTGDTGTGDTTDGDIDPNLDPGVGVSPESIPNVPDTGTGTGEIPNGGTDQGTGNGEDGGMSGVESEVPDAGPADDSGSVPMELPPDHVIPGNEGG